MIRRIAVVVAAAAITACGQTSTMHSPSLIQASQKIAQMPPGLSWFHPPTVDSWPEYITNGPDGNLWFTEFYTDKVVRLTPQGQFTEFALPQLNDVEAIVAGPDGDLWITEPGAQKIGRLSTTGDFTAFMVHGTNPSPRGICVGPDGNLWFAEYYDDHIGRITTSGVITRFALPAHSYPWEVVAGADGLIYVTDSASDRISRFDPVALKFLTPIALKAHDDPWGLALGPDKQVWFTGRTSGKIGVIVNGKPIEFKIGLQTAYPDDLAFGPDGNVWFTDSLRNRIGRFNPSTKTFLPNFVLSTKDIPTSIVAGPDGNMWFTNPSETSSDNKIGRITPQ